MPRDMDNLAEKFGELKRMLVHRASSALGEAGLKQFLTLLDGYHDELKRALETFEKERESSSGENTILLGLVGAGDVEVRAKLISQSEEIRFLRQELLNLRTESKKQENSNDALLMEVERLKKELRISFDARQQGQQGFENKIGELNLRLKSYEQQVNTKVAELSGEKTKLDKKLSGLDRQIEAQTEELVKKAVVRLGNVCREIEETTGVFKQEMDKLRAELSAVKKRGFKLFAGESLPKNILAPLLPSFNMLTEKTDEAANVLRQYMETFSAPEIKPSRVNWNKLFDDLKTKFSVQVSAKRIKVSWPSAKMPADFYSDQGLLAKAFGIVMQNALDALPVEGTINIDAAVSANKASIVFTDSGKAIKAEHREMLFTPLFTTKSSHYGMGLVNCRRIMRSLGGDAAYDPSAGVNSFKLTFASVDNVKAKK
jgi:signal transduction histidine kinase